MKNDQASLRASNSISMNKMKGKVSNYLNTHSKTNKSGKSARAIQFYKPMANLMIQALKSEQVILTTESGLSVDYSNLDLLCTRAEKVSSHSYFLNYFKTLNKG